MPGQRQDNSIVRLTSVAATVLESAQELARRTAGTRQIHARHLLGALLTATGRESGRPRPLAFDRIKSVGANLDDLRFRFREYIENGGRYVDEPDDLDEWRTHFTGFFEEVRRIPPFDPEGLRGDDRLGIMPDVRSFAMLAAAKNVVPPLSIGLFGDWCSGKSFFMQKLRDEIHRIAGDAKKKNDADEDTPFHGSIVQIEFNAWHYVEAKLWASLVTHIFDSLNQHFTRGGEVEDRERWAELLKKLGQEGGALHDAEADLNVAQKELEKATQKQKRARLGALAIAKAAWSGAKASGSWLKPSQNLTAVLGDKGVKDLQNDIVERGEEITALYSRARLTLSALWWQVRHVKTFVGALIASIITALALRWLIQRLDPEVLRGAMQVVVTIGGLVVGWVGAAIRRAKRAFDVIETVLDGIKQDPNNRAYSGAFHVAQKAVNDATKRVEQRRELVQQVRTEMRSLLPSQRLTSFLQEREQQRLSQAPGLAGARAPRLRKTSRLDDEAESFSAKGEGDPNGTR
ncbi:MAG: P-loop NTPase fold protein [Bryobacterales bacterium]